jgi:hypothetical protein
MKGPVGVWIDHRQAMIVALTDKGEKTVTITSNVEKQLRRAGDSPLKGAYEPIEVPADDRRQQALTGHLKIYYEAVVSRIRDAESILILGPGEAKKELKSRLEKDRLAGRIIGVESADKMTVREISLRVQDRLQKK